MPHLLAAGAEAPAYGNNATDAAVLDRLPRPPEPRRALRIPPEKHRQLAIEAAEQHVSLNQLVVSRL